MHERRLSTPSNDKLSTSKIFSVALAAALLLVPFAMTVQAQGPTGPLIPAGDLTVDDDRSVGTAETAAPTDEGSQAVDQPWLPLQKLTPIPPESDANAGESVAIGGSSLVVGAPGTQAVIVYTSSGAAWTEEARLTPSGPGASFGSSVDVSADGETVLVGAPWVSLAYVFERDGGAWTEVARLSPSDPQQGDFFGQSVALSADGLTAAVGAWVRDTSAGEEAGAGYVFEEALGGDGWDEVAKLTPDDAQPRDRLGSSVAISGNGDRVALAARAARQAVYVFDRTDAWTQVAHLSGGQEFGASLSISNDGRTLAVGDDDGQRVLVFEEDGTSWIEVARLTPKDADPVSTDGDFGRSVSLSTSGSTVVVGALGDDASPGGIEPPASVSLPFVTGREYRGSAYVFESLEDGWRQTAKVGPADGVHGDEFGSTVAMSSDGRLIGVGAPDDGVAPATMEEHGAVYVFSSLSGGNSR